MGGDGSGLLLNMFIFRLKFIGGDEKKMNYVRCIAAFFVGAGSLLLIWQNRYTEAMPLLVGMLAFFVGEKNVEKNAKKVTA